MWLPESPRFESGRVDRANIESVLSARMDRVVSAAFARLQPVLVALLEQLTFVRIELISWLNVRGDCRAPTL